MWRWAPKSGAPPTKVVMVEGPLGSVALLEGEGLMREVVVVCGRALGSERRIAKSSAMARACSGQRYHSRS